MYRLAIFLLAAALVLGACAAPAWAQSGGGWPDYPLDGHKLTRGAGGYFSLGKLITLWLLFLVWVRTTDWVSQDCQRMGMPTIVWTAANFFPFLLGFFLFALSIPYFALGFILELLAYGGPLGAYVYLRNKKAPSHLKVLTHDHLRFMAAEMLRPLGIKIAAEKKSAHEMGPPVNLTARGAKTETENSANLLLARQSPGFVYAKQLFSDALGHRADRIMLDYTAESVAVKFQVDGVWHDRDPLERESGDPLLESLKTLAACDKADRRSRQQGELGVEADKQKYSCYLTSQGTETGERVVLQLKGKEVRFDSLEALGMRDKVQEQLKQLLGSPPGILLFSSMPAGGLTTTLTTALRTTDRFMRDFVSIDDEKDQEPEVENVPHERYSKAGGQTPAAVLPRVIRKQPDVIVVRDLGDAQTVSLLAGFAEEKMVIGGIRAKEAAEALLRVLLLKVPPPEFAKAIKAVVNQRLVRKLCEECKEAYEPQPEILKKLGIPEGKIEALYRPPEPPENPKEICKKCGGVGYLGRTSIFELLVIDPALRKALVEQPKLDVLKALARKGGQRGLQEEGILLVARGVTSLPELMRVLKGEK